MPLNREQLKAAKSLQTLNDGNSIHTGRVGEDNPKKYYKLRINRSSHLDLSLTELKANADLALLNRKGKVLKQSAQKGRLNEAIKHTVTKGTYFVRVSPRQGNTRYRLSLAMNQTGNTTSLTTPAQPVQPTGFSPIAEQVVALTNAHRQQAGLKPLQLNLALTAAAQAHSEDMALNDFFSHTGSNGSRAFDRITNAGYQYEIAAENIAVGYATPNSVVQAWMNSPGHRENILYPDLKEIGIGFYFLETDPGTANYRYYWTQDFGTPAL